MYGGGGERGGDERNEEEEEALFGGVGNFRILVRTWVNICFSILSSFLHFDKIIIYIFNRLLWRSRWW